MRGDEQEEGNQVGKTKATTREYPHNIAIEIIHSTAAAAAAVETF
jgi:hypothetical protein